MDTGVTYTFWLLRGAIRNLSVRIYDLWMWTVPLYYDLIQFPWLPCEVGWQTASHAQYPLLLLP